MKSDKELTAEIVIAIINSGMKKPYHKDGQASVEISIEDIPALIETTYSSLHSLDCDKSEQ